jgi:hypothetical protein
MRKRCVLFNHETGSMKLSTRDPGGTPGRTAVRPMKQNMIFTKTTLAGKLVEIEIRSGTAFISVDGIKKCSTGMVERKPAFGPEKQFVGVVGCIALTQPEFTKVESLMQKSEVMVDVDKGDGTEKGGGIWSHCFTAEVQRSGDINKYSKFGA